MCAYYDIAGTIQATHCSLVQGIAEKVLLGSLHTQPQTGAFVAVVAALAKTVL